MMKSMKLWLVGIALSMGASFLQAQNVAVYQDASAPLHDRVTDLLKRMTVEEKISLLRATSPEIPRLGIAKYYHGNEALHGVVRPGRFTVFPQAIGMASGMMQIVVGMRL